MNRPLLLLLTFTSVANSAAQMARGRPLFAVISGMLGLLAFAAWVATASEQKVDTKG
jgi:hypothetical protein